MIYQRCGTSSIHLPLISLNLSPLADLSQEEGDKRLTTARELGLFHWDLCCESSEKQDLLVKRIADYLLRQNCRQQLFLSIGISPEENSLFRSAGRRGIYQQLNRILQYPAIDYLDLFMLSDPLGDTTAEESVQALIDEIKKGPVLYGGIKDFNTSDSQKRIDLMTDQDYPPLLLQHNYSLKERRVEQTLDHLLEMTGLTMIASNALNGNKEQESISLAEERKQSPTQFAIAWVLRQSYVGGVMLPLDSEEFLQEACRAMDNLAFD